MESRKNEISHNSTKVILQLLPPFPIVLVTTRTNIITIGQIHYFTFSPLRVGIAVAHKRFTHSLLQAEKEFVVNVPHVDLIEAVQVCGSISGRDGDKFGTAGLTKEQSVVVQGASIVECGAQIECKIEREFDFENRTWFVGKVVAARSRSDHRGSESVLCGRTEYVIPGQSIAPR